MAMLNESNLLAMKAKAAKFRTHHIGTKLNEGELHEFEALAEKRGQSPSELIRGLVLGEIKLLESLEEDLLADTDVEEDLLPDTDVVVTVLRNLFPDHRDITEEKRFKHLATNLQVTLKLADGAEEFLRLLDEASSVEEPGGNTVLDKIQDAATIPGYLKTCVTDWKQRFPANERAPGDGDMDPPYEEVSEDGEMDPPY